MATAPKPAPVSSALNAAQTRLEGALAKLEKTIAERATTPLSAADKEAIQAEITQSWEDHTAGLQEEIDRLKAENIKLSNQLKEVQEEYLTLQNVTQQASDRLDKSINTLGGLFDE